MAHLSGDPHMIEAFREGHDIHAATAAKIYKKPLEEVTREERSKAKTANFGIIYGITVFGLAERMNVSRAEAKELIDGYFITYPKVKEYMQKSIETAREKDIPKPFTIVNAICATSTATTRWCAVMPNATPSMPRYRAARRTSSKLP